MHRPRTDAPEKSGGCDAPADFLMIWSPSDGRLRHPDPDLAAGDSIHEDLQPVVAEQVDAAVPGHPDRDVGEMRHQETQHLRLPLGKRFDQAFCVGSDEVIAVLHEVDLSVVAAVGKLDYRVAAGSNLPP